MLLAVAFPSRLDSNRDQRVASRNSKASGPKYLGIYWAQCRGSHSKYWRVPRAPKVTVHSCAGGYNAIKTTMRMLTQKAHISKTAREAQYHTLVR